MKAITYPHHTLAPVIETIFIDGFKFEICEFNTEIARKEYNVDKSKRFFLVVEDNFYNHNWLEQYGAIIGDKVWRMYCSDKSVIQAIINDFEDALNSIETWSKRASKIAEGKYNSPMVKVNELKKSLKDRFGIQL